MTLNSPKINAIASLQLELAYYDLVVQLVSHYGTVTSSLKAKILTQEKSGYLKIIIRKTSLLNQKFLASTQIAEKSIRIRKENKQNV